MNQLEIDTFITSQINLNPSVDRYDFCLITRDFDMHSYVAVNCMTDDQAQIERILEGREC